MSAPSAPPATAQWLTFKEALALTGYTEQGLRHHCKRANFVGRDEAGRPRELFLTRARGLAWIHARSFLRWLDDGMPHGKGAW